MPPLSSSINESGRSKDVRDGVAKGFLAALMCCGNNFQHAGQTSLLSSAQGSAGATSITKDNFEKAVITFTVRRLPQASWTNDQDQFYQPNTANLPKDFISDCAIWAAFSNSNGTVSINKINYKGKDYRIKNNFYPYLLEDVRKWDCSLESIKTDLSLERENRFLSLWIKERKLPPQANDVFEAGKIVYKKFYSSIKTYHWKNYKIENWDLGFWQIRKALTEKSKICEELEELKRLHKILGLKILPLLYQFGFILKDVEVFK
jgi:hypothetical protein